MSKSKLVTINRQSKLETIKELKDEEYCVVVVNGIKYVYKYKGGKFLVQNNLTSDELNVALAII